MGKLAVLVAACAVALTAAGPAAADYTLIVSPPMQNGSHATELSLSTGDSLRAPGDVALYVPSGYGLDLEARAGTRVGELTEFADGVAGAVSFANADLWAIDPAQAGADAAACAPGPHAAAWSATGSTSRHRNFTFTIFADATTGAETADGAYVLRWCTPAALGHVDTLAIDLTILTRPSTPGMYLWRAVATPTGLPSSLAVELRALEPIPNRLRVTAHVLDRVRRRLAIRGSLVVAGVPKWNAPIYALPLPSVTPATSGGAAVGVTVGAASGGLRAPHTWTLRNGTFALRVPLPRAAVSQVVVAALGSFAALCGGPSIAPGGCESETTTPPAPVLLRVSLPAAKARR